MICLLQTQFERGKHEVISCDVRSSAGLHPCHARIPASGRFPSARNSKGNTESSSSSEGQLASGDSGTTRHIQDHVQVPSTNPSGRRAAPASSLLSVCNLHQSVDEWQFILSLGRVDTVTV
jgi:hypothetical protein